MLGGGILDSVNEVTIPDLVTRLPLCRVGANDALNRSGCEVNGACLSHSKRSYYII